MASEIEDLLKEQEMANNHLQLLDENKELFEDILFESLLFNENIGSLSTVVSKLDKTMVFGLGGISKSINDMDFEVPTVTPDSPINTFNPNISVDNNVPLSPPPSVVNETPIVNIAGAQAPIISSPGVEVLPALNAAVPVAEEIEDASLSIIEATAITSDKSLMGIDAGISDLVSVQEAQFRADQDAEDIGSTSGGKDKASESVSDIPDLGFLSKIPGLGKLAGLASKVAGFAQAAAAPLAAVLVTGKLLTGLYEGFGNEKVAQEIAGKGLDALSDAETSAVAISHALGGVVDGADSLVNFISGGIIDKGTISGLFPDKKTIFENITGAVGGIQSGIDQLIDPEVGLLGGFTKSIFKLLDGDFLGAAKTAGASLLGFPAKVVEKLSEWLGSLFDSITELLPTSVSDLLGNASDSIKGFFGIEGDVLDNINKGAKKEQGFIDGLFGADKDSEEEDLFARGAAIIAKNKADRKAKQAELGKKKTFVEPSTIVDNTSASRFDKSIIAPKQSQDGSRPISPNINTQDAVIASKQNINEPRIIIQPAPAPQPIVVNAPAPEKKVVTRRTESNDMSLAVMNSGTLD